MPVAVIGPMTIFLSNCLHSIVDELLRTRNKEDVRRPQVSAQQEVVGEVHTHIMYCYVPQMIIRESRELPNIVFYETPEPIEDEPASIPSSPSVDTTDAPSDNDSTQATPTTPTSPANTNSKPSPTTKKPSR